MDSSGIQKGGEQQGRPQPPPGYPTEATATQKQPCWPHTTTKDDKGFIEGCLAALCCCWICETCCF